VEGRKEQLIGRREDMAKEDKKLCKWKEDRLTEKLDELMDIVREPKFLCKKCGRVANDEKLLHKPISIK
jgi:riboflavin synthase